MTILLTGFNPFVGIDINPTEAIVEEMRRRVPNSIGLNLVAEVLPTEFAEAGNKIIHLIRQYRPERVLCLGLQEGSDQIRFERVALNLDDAIIPDNAGFCPIAKTIASDGPVAYWSTLPIEEMYAVLTQSGIPAVISNHAGTYVCNHVFYIACHEIERSRIGCRCGFVHVPQASQPPFGLPLATLMDAIERCLHVLKVSV